MTEENAVVLILIAGGAVALVAILVALRRWQRAAKELEDRASAEIVELVVLTGLGRLSVGLLLVWNLFAVLALSRVGSTVFQEVAMSLFWIGGNLLFGLGIVVGRSRRFLVRQRYAWSVAPVGRPAIPGAHADEEAASPT